VRQAPIAPSAGECEREFARNLSSLPEFADFKDTRQAVRDTWFGCERLASGLASSAQHAARRLWARARNLRSGYFSRKRNYAVALHRFVLERCGGSVMRRIWSQRISYVARSMGKLSWHALGATKTSERNDRESILRCSPHPYTTRSDSIGPLFRHCMGALVCAAAAHSRRGQQKGPKSRASVRRFRLRGGLPSDYF